jgi:hypothetical protein
MHATLIAFVVVSSFFNQPIGAGPASPRVLVDTLGIARVSSVVPTNGGCVFQDSLPLTSVENWDVQEGFSYAVTLTQVTDCANGGTDATIGVIVKSSNTGNMCLVATKVATGTYTFTVTMPAASCHTYPIMYCATSCSGGGMLARRADGGAKASHLRASVFGPGCSAPSLDSDCTPGCSAWITNLGGGCGAPAPTLHGTMPLIGYDALISVKGAPAGAPVLIAGQVEPFPPSIALGGGCIAHVDPATAAILGPFTTTVIGDFYLPLFLPPQLPIFQARIQAAVIAPGGPLATVQLTNGIQTRFGNCAPFCTYPPNGYAPGGGAALTFEDNFENVFATGLEIGVYDAGNGGLVPNGLRWTGDAAGKAALAALIAGGAAPSGPLSADAINPVGTNGGGSLAIEAAGLALNLGFNAAGMLGGAHTNLASIVYLKMDIFDALSGLTIAQILGVANQALAGNGLPAGYTYDSLATFLAFLNRSFENCALSTMASHRLYNPDSP